MKSTLVLLFISFSAFSQFQKSGKIYFKESIKLNIQISEENKEMAKMMPTSQDSYKVLYYDSNESHFADYYSDSLIDAANWIIREKG